jgi:hypothetical protein
MDIKTRFSTSLNQQLLQYYRRIPSASILARDFNSRSQGLMNPITQETARRWIRGLSMPEMDKLQVLINWLDLNIDLNFKSIAPEIETGGQVNVRRTSVVLNEAEAQLLQIFRETDVRGKRVLLSLAKTLMQPDPL